MLTDFVDPEARTETPKARPCLMCKKDFPSEWSGERICGRCKGTSAWRNGLSYSSGRFS